MNYVSVGDMAQSYQLRRHGVQLKTVMTQLTEEVMTGVKQDAAKAVGGNFGPLAAIDRTLSMIEAYDLSAKEAGLRAAGMQGALGLMQESAADLGTGLLALSGAANPQPVQAALADAAQRFEAVIFALNAEVAGRHLFAGAASDTTPVAGADAILTALSTQIAGLANAADIEAAVAAWFDAPQGGGGFLDAAYLGSYLASGPVQLAEGEGISLDLRISTPGLRQTLTGFAMAALVGRDMVPQGDQLRADLAQAAGEHLLSAESALVSFRADLGVTEAAIEDARTRNSAEKSSLELDRIELIGADPYESATALQAVETQLETLYTLTARLSALSLADYL
ncbi:flagellar hook protein [Sinirhodobacter sp. WL0062]|uniref:Flagellar hook protein n=1 Tax=Rhodobacter flavimaris TaxID=2907145 RepID=A0ABS8YY64_9RHOB|nr:flagellin [Sinirhodobacter sp. WL0062]MCE5974752.1 flagellar hook protein [Sinirhodobacter sp. WL0062]